MTLVTVDDLAALIQGGEEDLVVCDVRFDLADLDLGHRDYTHGHIPGARFVDVQHELSAVDPRGPRFGGRHPLPEPEAFAALLGSLGVRPGDFVVAYDSSTGAYASRLWAMLRFIGHTRAAVLDGGWNAWLSADLPVTADIPTGSSSQYPVPPRWRGVVDAEEVRLALAMGEPVVDARAPDRFRGEWEPIDPIAGHIPGASNHHHLAVVGPDGCFLPPDVLAAQFKHLGDSPIVYCGSGVTACQLLLGMTVAGIPRARLYAGSWSEWCSDELAPVATGG